MTFIDDYAETIVKPGHGYGNGAALIRRGVRTVRHGEVKEVFAVLTLADMRSGEQERVYLTADGFVISPVADPYVKWGLTGKTDGARAALKGYQKHIGIVGTGIIFTSNLGNALGSILGARRQMREDR